MGLPTSYLTSYKNLPAILSAVQNAQAPKNFTTRFLESLGYKNTADRLIIGVFKAIGFLTQDGTPTSRYFEFLDQTQSKKVLAQGIQEAYADIFQINKKAYELSGPELKNKLKTLTQGQVGDAVLDKMVGTFKALAQQGEFSATTPSTVPKEIASSLPPPQEPRPMAPDRHLELGGLVYNIQIVLPGERDRAVYDALFRSLKEHLLT